MRYFKKGDAIFAYEDDQLDLVTDEMTEVKGKELKAILNPPSPEPILSPLTNRQFKLALLDADLIDDVETAISKIEDSKVKRTIQIEYEYATTFHRDSESIQTMADLLKLDSESVNDLWSKALLL